jgi:hypothetical protein
VHELAETQDTPLRALSVATRLGLGATDQAVPFHDSANARLRPLLA